MWDDSASGTGGDSRYTAAQGQAARLLHIRRSSRADKIGCLCEPARHAAYSQLWVTSALGSGAAACDDSPLTVRRRTWTAVNFSHHLNALKPGT